MSEGVLRGRAIYLMKPYYPLTDGRRIPQIVYVKVIIDEKGHVISAHAINNVFDPRFRIEAENAAKYSTFTPTLKDGIAVKMTGILTYNFAP